MNLPLRSNVPNQVSLCICAFNTLNLGSFAYNLLPIYSPAACEPPDFFVLMCHLPVFLQGTLNAQMLAQRQREYLNNQIRQRQQQQHVHQQRAMMMRTQGINMPPSMPTGGAAPTPMPMGGTNPRLPQGNPQQFPYPASSYGTSLPSPPPPPPPHPGSSSPFSSSLSPSHHLTSQGMMGNVGGQYSGVMSPPSQHSAFQFSSSGILLLENSRGITAVCVCFVGGVVSFSVVVAGIKHNHLFRLKSFFKLTACS